MKRLALFFMALAMFTASYASNEHLVVMQSDGPTDGPVTRLNPCTQVPFKVTYIIPSNYYAVARFEWYVNNVLYTTTTSTSGGYGGTTIPIKSQTDHVVCKVIYTNGSTETAPAATNEVVLEAKLNPYTLHGPTNLDLGSRTVTYTLDNPQVGPDFYVLNAGSYTVNWEGPAGWTLVSSSNTSATFTVDDYSSGTVKVNFTLTSCGYHETSPAYQKNVTRNYPPVSFTNPNPPNVCASSPNANYAVNPQPVAVSYTYTIYEYWGGYPDGVVFAANGQQSITTSASSVAINYNTSNDLIITLGVKANYGNGISSSEVSEQIGYMATESWPGSNIDVVYSPNDCYGGWLSATAPYISGATYYWYMDGVLVDVGGNGTSLDYRGQYTLSVMAQTSCASTGYIYQDINYGCGCCLMGASAVDANSISVYPNPTISEVTLSVKDGVTGKTITAAAGKVLREIREVKMLDKFGSVKKIVKFSTGTKTAKLSLGTLPADVYVLEISDGVNKVSKWISKVK